MRSPEGGRRDPTEIPKQKSAEASADVPPQAEDEREPQVEKREQDEASVTEQSQADSLRTVSDVERVKREDADSAKIAEIRESLGLETSFAEKLRPTSFDARNIRLWKLPGDDTKLVRESITQEGKTLDETERAFREGETLFGQMRDQYGINVVSMDTRREKNTDGQEAVFTTVDFIDGKNLSDLESLPPESGAELEQLYSSLGSYYRDAWKQKGKFWGDARSDQFVYGAKKGEEEKHFYLTDVDPEFYQEGQDKWRTIEAVMGSVCHDLVENEAKLQGGVRLEGARAKLLEIVGEMLAENPDWKMLDEAKEWLTK